MHFPIYPPGQPRRCSPSLAGNSRGSGGCSADSSSSPCAHHPQIFSEVAPLLNATVGVWESDELQIDLRSLPAGRSFVNVWQRPLGVIRATTAGVPTVYSGSYYLDQENPGGCHTYAWQQARVGGEMRALARRRGLRHRKKSHQCSMLLSVVMLRCLPDETYADVEVLLRG